jgi:glycerate kinase
MRVLIAPDSFKESLSAVEAAEAIARGLRAAGVDEPDLCPVADGGEGTVEALVNATDGQYRQSTVHGPLGQTVTARWGLLGRSDGQPLTAVIEMAEAAGLHLVPADQRDPTRTTTYGVGQLLIEALDAGARRIIMGIGGSATCDGGAGMAQAIGVRFARADGSPCVCGLAGGGLGEVARIDLTRRDSRLGGAELIIACDVTNPLTGPNGAAAVYGPQKGATPQQVSQLDANLAHLAGVYRTCCALEGAAEHALDDMPGAGAAGGLGFGLVAFAGARLQRGIELVLDTVDFDERLNRANLVITGEGRLDGQSIRGKTCMGVAQRAARRSVPTVALVGSAADDAGVCLDHGLAAYHTLVGDTVTSEQAIARAKALLEALAQRVIEQWRDSVGA